MQSLTAANGRGGFANENQIHFKLAIVNLGVGLFNFERIFLTANGDHSPLSHIDPAKVEFINLSIDLKIIRVIDLAETLSPAHALAQFRIKGGQATRDSRPNFKIFKIFTGEDKIILQLDR